MDEAVRDETGCGLKNVHMSCGHDEYLYRVTNNCLPEPAQYMIRYHSCYPVHREAPTSICSITMKFNPYDLYSKSDSRPELKDLKPFYDDLINESIPGKLRW